MRERFRPVSMGYQNFQCIDQRVKRFFPLNNPLAGFQKFSVPEAGRKV